MSKCKVEGCNNKAHRRELCIKHCGLKKGRCIIPGCDGEHGTRGMCAKHYSRWQKYGDANIIKQKQLHGVSIKDRLYANTKATDNGSSAVYKYCLEWTGAKDKKGYGRMNINGNPILVHRVSWEIHNGPIPEGKSICHKCDNPPCIRADHLFICDALLNNQDCIQKGRDRKRGLKGEEHNLAKLTETQVTEIRNSDERGVDLAKRYNIGQTTISDIQKGRSWRHLKYDSKRFSVNRTYKLIESDVLAIRASNENSRILAEQYGVTIKALADARYGRSWKYLPGAQVAVDRSPLAKKFTIEDILAIRASNESSKVLAAKHEVDRSSINNIRSRRTWNHID